MSAESKDDIKTSEEHEEVSDSPEFLKDILNLYPKGKQSVVNMLLGAAASVAKVASKTADISSRVGKILSASPEQASLLREAGASLRDLREVAGLTVRELSEAIRLPDQSLLAAVENGTATLSFELILRLAALLARHDPLPFVIRYTRTYNPEVWAVLESWGAGRLPLQLERERQFINIYRSCDAARNLSDRDFERVLEFTRSAFEMALGFVSEK